MVVSLFLSTRHVPLLCLGVLSASQVGDATVVLNPTDRCNETDEENVFGAYCTHATSCRQLFNDRSPIAEELPLQQCRDEYYSPTCANVTSENFNPACLPIQLSRCLGDDTCSQETVMMFFYAETCGLDALRVKYGPDKVLLDRRIVYRRLFSIILENIVAFVAPNLLVIATCLIFHAKSKAKKGANGERSAKVFGCIPREKYEVIMRYVAIGGVCACLCLAVWTACCSMYRFWKEVHVYHESLDFGTHCNFVLSMEFIGYRHAFEILALAAFTVMDLVVVMTLSVWSCCLLTASICSVYCCQVRFFICCVWVKYCNCMCCLCFCLTQLCTQCAVLVFIICLIPLLIYFFGVSVIGLIMYGLLLLLLALLTLVLIFVLRQLLAALTCGKVIEWTTPEKFWMEFVFTLQVETARAAGHENDAAEDVKAEESESVSRFVRWGVWTIVVPVVLLVVSSTLYPLADASLQMYAMNFVDMQWFYDRFNNPWGIWSVLFKQQWMSMAEGITDFAANVFVNWPVNIYRNVADLFVTGEDDATRTFEENLDLTKMWLSNDWRDYKNGIIVARVWLSFFEGVIAVGLAIKYSMTRKDGLTFSAEEEDELTAYTDSEEDA